MIILIPILAMIPQTKFVFQDFRKKSTVGGIDLGEIQIGALFFFFFFTFRGESSPLHTRVDLISWGEALGVHTCQSVAPTGAEVEGATRTRATDSRLVGF